jgi:hypothetical protein
MKNVKMQPAEGAVYAFPKVELSEKVIEEAIILVFPAQNIF